jgi:hypothetical protein
LVDPALAWSNGLRVEVGGAGTVAHAGMVLPRLLADRLGLTGDLAQVVRGRGSLRCGTGVGCWSTPRVGWRPGRRRWALTR